MEEKRTKIEGTDFLRMDLDSYDGDEPYIFISYSHADTEQVYRILKVIDKEKYRFWYDDTMEIGEDFREELRSRIEHCSAFLLFISPASLASKYCGMEIITAYKYDKKIYPVYLDENAPIPAPLKMILENLQHLKNVPGEKYIYKLISGLPVETMRSLQTEDGVLVKCKDGSTSLTIPDDIHTIGAGAFKNCEKLEKVELGDTVENISREAFRGCKSLTSMHLPKNVRKVNESAFRDCISMTSLKIDCDDIELGERAFENCASLSDIELADGMTEIYGGVFNSCKSLENIKLPSKLTVLGESAFADCSKLKSIKIPDRVTKIDDIVFNGCLELEKVELNSGLVKLGKKAFKDCQSLKEIFIPKNVNSIGSGIFRGCISLKTIIVDPKNRFYKSVNNVLFNKNKSDLLCFVCDSDVTEYEIPDSVMTISDWAFCNSHLKKITIPDSVTSIGEGAFCNCLELEELVLPDSVMHIDDSAFRGCTKLKKLVLPDSIVDFGWGLLGGCDDVVVVCNDRSNAAKYCDSREIPHVKPSAEQA